MSELFTASLPGPVKKEEILKILPEAKIIGELPSEFYGVECDSRRVTENSLFFAISGFKQDGKQFVPEAVKKGATGVVAANFGLETEVAWLVVPEIRTALAKVSHLAYRHPAARLTLFGVTGTNGKSTVAFLMRDILKEAGTNPAVLGTIAYEFAGESIPAWNTTPESLDLARFFYNIAQRGGKAASLEVSSHALALGRVEEIFFDVAVFTNLTRDHLDFHKTMEAYREEKLKLFTRHLKPSGKAVLNLDAPESEFFRKLTKGMVFTYSAEHPTADLHAVKYRFTTEGTEVDFAHKGKKFSLKTQLVGPFNLQNLLAAAAAGLAYGYDAELVKSALEKSPPVPGRVEQVKAGQPFIVVVDYAHTPDGIEQILKLARFFKPKRVLVAFGCGGDRDKGKRPLMAQAAEKYADLIFLTSDNPRSEPPEEIIKETLFGFSDRSKVRTITDRREALSEMVQAAQDGDFLVACGKGHEVYQQIGDKKFPFDDREVFREALKKRGYADGNN
ncbi:MAG: UDP-N-acetylmuramoyl-L-alanyl-D-glutamate--2,6-diaminopimelate ligase [candidate division Zixibacteria bacterium]|nr:UDP-N-acetylmuramoyl-L-alanyl-D-glutamate--2,6-diaminopimelate ligase [candidate division Zixibacteria bacterium]